MPAMMDLPQGKIWKTKQTCPKSPGTQKMTKYF
jgi:hypothetical protein